MFADEAQQVDPTLAPAVWGARMASELRERAGLLGSLFTPALTRQLPFTLTEHERIDEATGRIDELRHLMVLRIEPPSTRDGQSLGEVFWNVTVPDIIFFLITFAVIVIFWLHHHDVFKALGPQGIRSNLVAAGPVKTVAAKSIPGFDDFEAVWSTRAPIGWDLDDPIPAAKACAALLSDWFPATTGEIVHVDGGDRSAVRIGIAITLARRFDAHLLVQSEHGLVRAPRREPAVGFREGADRRRPTQARRVGAWREGAFLRCVADQAEGHGEA